MEHITHGVTSDFDWYELQGIRTSLMSLATRVDMLIQATQQREKTQHDYILYLRSKADELQGKLNLALEKK